MRAFRPFALVTAIVLAGAMTSCSKTTVEHKSSLGSPAANPSPGQPTPTVTPTSTKTAASTATSTATNTATNTATKADTKPHIVSFVVTRQPQCPIIATSDSPFHQDGVNIKLKWRTANATQVALSIDSPNFYGTTKTGSYGVFDANSEIELPFNCDPTDQPNTTHSFTIDTIGAVDDRKTITVTKQTSP
jgi:hypothetical protein